MSTDMSLICFNAIVNFTNELVEHFSKHQRSLKLYGRLINKTTISHKESIQKHISSFHKFCVSNRDAIFSKNTNLSVAKIEYSSRVYIDMENIIKHSDKDSLAIIWQHLLTISALVDPAGKAKEVLKENLASGKTSQNETDFLTNIINKVEPHVSADSNPMQAISSIMSSGIFTDLLGGMNSGISNGSLDLSKLMGAVQSMVGNNGGDGSDQSGQAMNMISNLMGSMGGISGTQDGTPDIATMMQSMMSGLGNMNNHSPIPSVVDSVKIEEVEISKSNLDSID